MHEPPTFETQFTFVILLRHLLDPTSYKDEYLQNCSITDCFVHPFKTTCIILCTKTMTRDLKLGHPLKADANPV